MIEQILQMGSDFVAANGMMALVVVILAVLMYRGQTAAAKQSEQQGEENERQAANFTIESRQQSEILKILRAEVANNAANVANNAALINKVEQLKTDLITEAQSISDASTLPLINTMDEIMTTLTPLEQSLADIREELRQLRQSVDIHLESSNAFRDIVTAKTIQIEDRLIQVEKTATQETPAIQTDSDKPKAEPKLKTIPIGKETTNEQSESK